MTHRQRHRLLTTLFVVLSLLFTQLALARHVCASLAAGLATAVAAHAPATVPIPTPTPAPVPVPSPHETPAAGHAHCQGQAIADLEEAGTVAGTPPATADGLCAAHCADPAKSPEAPPAPVLSQPAVLQELVLTVSPLALPAAQAGWSEAPRRPPPPEPLFLATRRLRV